MHIEQYRNYEKMKLTIGFKTYKIVYHDVGCLLLFEKRKLQSFEILHV